VPVFLRLEKSLTNKGDCIYDSNFSDIKSKPVVITAVNFDNKSTQIKAPSDNTYGIRGTKKPDY
tara:strand:+ start:8647 stop:8838 length:192 start_codon:yes stop_codon:yes gene_type:complete